MIISWTEYGLSNIGGTGMNCRSIYIIKFLITVMKFYNNIHGQQISSDEYYSVQGSVIQTGFY